MTDTPTPVWVRVADGISLGLVALVAWSALTGGSRTMIFGVVLSTRSPLLLLYGAVSLLIVRHLLHGRPSARQRMREAWTALTARPVLAAAVRAFLLTRPAVLLVGILAVGAFGFPRQVGFILSDDPVTNLPGRFDAGWYGGIALDGYNWDHTFQRQRNIAFFPAMPLLMRPLGAVFGMYDESAPRERRMIRGLWAGVVISLAAFLWALHYLVRLGRELVGDERASTAVLLLAAYPFSVFYSAPYTESLFLLGAIAACFHFRRQEWAAAACWGLVVGLTRPNGCFLSAALALMAWQSRASHAGVSRRAVSLAVAATPVIGMLIFTVYLYGLTGVWFAWARSHAAWGRTFQGAAPFVTFFNAVREQSLLQVFASSPFNSLNGLAMVFAAAMVWPVVRRLGLAWGVFMLVNLLPPFFAGGVVSIGRLTSTLFPIFLALSLLIPPRQVATWAAAFGIGQGLVAALFFTWRELY
jgi:hypothetical protein